ncbi:hypothetical protein A7P53_07135 [Acinetobacter defluvii]|uniref:hypothetical protein n=1 Tax=Acinetobacter defluvii TaxID=1871111 RepID=UPI00148F5D7F|nr:hypothetical protein [Acinetobacter defluvii]NNP72238.1 hypothetical protein [Acinetobacter defluvii]
MVKAKKYQFLAIVILVIASLNTFVAFIYDDAFCVAGYGREGITYFNQLNGFTSDEPLLFVFAGIIGLIFAIFLSFTTTKFCFLAVNFVMLMFMALPMIMFSAAPFYQVIYDSIFLCGHFVLGIAAVLFYLYWLFVAIYLLKAES